ncbi:hypothetical protein BH10CYA1_BH10CYA1_18440 [soil metagenome]
MRVFKSRKMLPMRKHLTPRRELGASAIELSVGAFLFATISAISVDLALCVIANGVNNQACRDAARAAGMALPADARKAANYALNVHQRVDGNFIKSLKITKFLYNGTGAFGTADVQDPTNQPMVSVCSEISVSVPAPAFLIGSKFTTENGNFTFSSGYLYPILNADITLPKGEFDPNHNGFTFPQPPVVPTPCDDAPPGCPEPVTPIVPPNPGQPPLGRDPSTPG